MSQRLSVGQLKPAGIGSCRRSRQAWKARPHPRDKPRRPSSAREQTGLASTDPEYPEPASPASQDLDPAVAEALLRVHEAVRVAEDTLEHIEELPSAREPSQWDALLEVARPALQALALVAACFATHAFGAVARGAGSLLVALAMALGGYRKGSLNPSGALAALLVGLCTLGPSFRAGLTLLTFFFTSSKLTQLGEELKEVDEEHKKGGQRDWRQVACNALVPTALTLAAARATGGVDVALGGAAGGAATALLGAFLGYYACCCGDTWASELGQLSDQEPVLITTLRPVRKGTNGGVTFLGLGASLAGGLCMGLTFWLTGALSPGGAGGAALRQWRLVPFGVAAGLVGSLIDSLLGATIQFTGYNLETKKITGRPGPQVAPISGLAVLDNNAVNFVSASATAALAALAAVRLFP